MTSSVMSAVPSNVLTPYPRYPVGMRRNTPICVAKRRFVVPRGGLTETSRFNKLDCQTALQGAFDPQGQLGALSNHCSHRPVASPIFPLPSQNRILIEF